MKFHFHTGRGIKNLSDTEAEATTGKDREGPQEDLHEVLERVDYPAWAM